MTDSVHFTDLEKALYGSPAVDLGHATVLTSTLWDIDVQAELSFGDVQNFYAAYLGFLPAVTAAALQPLVAADAAPRLASVDHLELQVVC